MHGIFERPPAFYQRQSGPTVGGVTDGPLGRVTTWRTCSLGVLRGGDILPLSENSIFYTFCIFSWPQIANGSIDADHILHSDDYVNGS